MGISCHLLKSESVDQKRGFFYGDPFKTFENSIQKSCIGELHSLRQRRLHHSLRKTDGGTKCEK